MPLTGVVSVAAFAASVFAPSAPVLAAVEARLPPLVSGRLPETPKAVLPIDPPAWKGEPSAAATA